MSVAPILGHQEAKPGGCRNSSRPSPAMQKEEGAVAKLICICPTERDHRELAALSNGHMFLHHDYATSALEDLTARDGRPAVSIENPDREIESILNRCREEAL